MMFTKGESPAMKRLFSLLILIGLIGALAACGLATTQTTGTTASTQTTGSVSVVLQEEMTRIRNLIPISTNSDLTLPVPTVPGLTVVYSADGIELSGNVLPYDFPEADHSVELSIILSMEGQTHSATCSVMMVYDADLFAAHQTDMAFELVDERLRAGIPETVKTDITLPTVPDVGVEVVFSTDVSYVYEGRLVFDFPISDLEVELEASVTIGQTTRSFTYGLVMKGLASLQRIPEIYIETAGHAPIVSKEEYVSATFSMVTYDENNVPTEVMTAKSIGIRGRGNSTFFMPKMPYRIKFSEKTALLGDYAEKSWVLLANYSDQTLIRNYLAYDFAHDLGMDFAPGVMFADLFLNGEYVGNYMITDQVEVTKNRVNVQKDSTETDTGFLVELDQKIIDYPEGVEGLDWFVVEGYHFMVKEPASDEDYRTAAQFAYIEDYFGTLFSILRDGEDYSGMIDVDTFIDWFIVNEVFKNVDSGYSSVYFYKDAGGLLKMGPVWDFDLSAGNQQSGLVWELRQPTGWYTARWDKNRIFYYLFEYESFRTALRDRWIQLYDSGTIPGLLGKIYPTADSITYSRYLNFLRWDVIGKNNEWYTNPEVLAADSYPKQLELLYDYLQTRIAWLDDYVRGLN